MDLLLNHEILQGGGNAPVEIARNGARGGVPAHAFTDCAIATADHLFKLETC